jgi:hypothetical protein
MTAETLAVLLLGDPDASATQMAPADKPLLEKGIYESVAVSADAARFADVSHGALSKDDVLVLEKGVVEKLNKPLRRRGFSATEVPYPPAVTTEKTLVATLVPIIHESGSEEEKRNEKNKKLILVRLTVSDPRTNDVLAQRDYYSGADVRRPGESTRRLQIYR